MFKNRLKMAGVLKEFLPKSAFPTISHFSAIYIFSAIYLLSGYLHLLKT